MLICGFYEEFLKRIYNDEVESDAESYFKRYKEEIRNISACCIRLRAV
jgi:proline dehydrogenase